MGLVVYCRVFVIVIADSGFKIRHFWLRGETETKKIISEYLIKNSDLYHVLILSMAQIMTYRHIFVFSRWSDYVIISTV